MLNQENPETFKELAAEFYYAAEPDGYNAYYGIREFFEPGSEKRKIIDALIKEEEESERSGNQSIEF